MIPRLTRDAKEDLREALRWYRAQALNLDREFLDCFGSCLSVIATFPDAFALVHERVRRAPMRRFPYSVFYMTRGDAFVVVAVWHTRRDPEALHRRLG